MLLKRVWKKADEEPTLSLSTLFQFSENHQMSFQRDCHSQSAGVSPKSKKMAKNVKTQFRMKLPFTWCKRQTVKSIKKRAIRHKRRFSMVFLLIERSKQLSCIAFYQKYFLGKTFHLFCKTFLNICL